MRARQSGFTLLEVVVAFVVLALIMGTVFQIFSTGLGKAAELDEYSGALVVAQSRLALVGQEEQLAEGETSGETDDRRYQWKVTVQKAPPTNEQGQQIQGNFELYRADVLVGWQGGDGRAKQFTIASLMVGPKQ